MIALYQRWLYSESGLGMIIMLDLGCYLLGARVRIMSWQFSFLEVVCLSGLEFVFKLHCAGFRQWLRVFTFVAYFPVDVSILIRVDASTPHIVYLSRCIDCS